MRSDRLAHPRTRIVATLVSLILVAGTALILQHGLTAQASPTIENQTPGTPPNVVIVLTDDQRAGTEIGMPTVMRELAARGTSWSNAVVPTSWCCPSRASLLTGNFSHTSGVWENTAGNAYGAWPSFYAGGWEDKTLATALDAQGYRTGLFGKYLNSFKLAGPGYVPPGWDTFDAFLGGNYSRYRLSSDPYPVTGKRRYLTDELSRRAVSFIRSTPADHPLFLYFSPFAPHAPYDPGPYAGASKKSIDAVFEATNFPAPTYMDRELQGKPRWLRNLPVSDEWFTRIDEPSGHTVEEVARMQQDTLMGVDAAVADLIDALETTGRMKDTLFIFVSDNGYSWGEHRLQGKNTPYSSSVDVPLIMRFDGRVPAGVVRDEVVAANIDTHATVLQAADTRPHAIDGISLLRSRVRDGVPMEAMRWKGWRKRPAYCGWRSREGLFVRYASGEEELYDYRVDPFEQRNVIGQTKYADWERQMRQLARENCDPPPPGFAWPDAAPVKAQAPTRVTVNPRSDDWLTLRWVAPRNIGAARVTYRVVARAIGSDVRVTFRGDKRGTVTVTDGRKKGLCSLESVSAGLFCNIRPAFIPSGTRLQVAVQAIFDGASVAQSSWITLP